MVRLLVLEQVHTRGFVNIRLYKMTQKSFTLMEVVMTALIVTVLAAITIPNINGMINRSITQDMLKNLVAIHAAEQNYYQNNGKYYVRPTDPPDTSCLTCINWDGNGTAPTCSDGVTTCAGGLNLNIINSDRNTLYHCNDPSSNCASVASIKSLNGSTTKMLVYLTIPVGSDTAKSMVSRYCSNNVPDATYNPCCVGVAGPGGANCP